MRGTSLFTATLRTRKEFLPCQGLSWPGGRTIGALRAERQILASANGTSCSARHKLRSRAFLFIVSAECALPTNASLFVIFARILANAPHDSLRTCFVCATHAHPHFFPQHWLLCHLGLYWFEFEFEFEFELTSAQYSDARDQELYILSNDVLDGTCDMHLSRLCIATG